MKEKKALLLNHNHVRSITLIKVGSYRWSIKMNRELPGPDPAGD